MIEDKEGMIIKDCSKCLIPHSKNGYDYIIEKLQHTNKKEGV